MKFIEPLGQKGRRRKKYAHDVALDSESDDGSIDNVAVIETGGSR